MVSINAKTKGKRTLEEEKMSYFLKESTLGWVRLFDALRNLVDDLVHNGNGRVLLEIHFLSLHSSQNVHDLLRILVHVFLIETFFHHEFLCLLREAHSRRVSDVFRQETRGGWFGVAREAVDQVNDLNVGPMGSGVFGNFLVFKSPNLVFAEIQTIY